MGRGGEGGGGSRHFYDFSLEKSVFWTGACGCARVAGRTCECVHKRACACRICNWLPLPCSQLGL